jgi:hypothetical protein
MKKQPKPKKEKDKPHKNDAVYLAGIYPIWHELMKVPLKPYSQKLNSTNNRAV